MPAPLPVLPSALFKPLECDPASCKHPGVPLDSDRLSAALSLLLWRKIDSSTSALLPEAKERMSSRVTSDKALRGSFLGERGNGTGGAEGIADMFMMVMGELAGGGGMMAIDADNDVVVRRHYAGTFLRFAQDLFDGIGSQSEFDPQESSCLHDILAGVAKWVES